MARDDFHFVHTLRVRYDEIDGQRIVYNGRYLTYMDIAQTEYFRTGLGLHLYDLADANIFDVATVHVELDYLRSFVLDDLVTIGVRCTAIGTTSLTFAFEMWKEGDPDASFRATAVFVNFDPAQRAKRPVPAIVREAIARLERWERV
jgi:acyl-CoA thioester hydrolase